MTDQYVVTCQRCGVIGHADYGQTAYNRGYAHQVTVHAPPIVTVSWVADPHPIVAAPPEEETRPLAVDEALSALDAATETYRRALEAEEPQQHG